MLKAIYIYIKIVFSSVISTTGEISHTLLILMMKCSHCNVCFLHCIKVLIGESRPSVVILVTPWAVILSWQDQAAISMNGERAMHSPVRAACIESPVKSDRKFAPKLRLNFFFFHPKITLLSCRSFRALHLSQWSNVIGWMCLSLAETKQMTGFLRRGLGHVSYNLHLCHYGILPQISSKDSLSGDILSLIPTNKQTNTVMSVFSSPT